MRIQFFYIFKTMLFLKTHLFKITSRYDTSYNLLKYNNPVLLLSTNIIKQYTIKRHTHSQNNTK